MCRVRLLVGADRNAHDVVCDSHAPSTAVQRGSRSEGAAEKRHRWLASRLVFAAATDPCRPSGRRAASFPSPPALRRDSTPPGFFLFLFTLSMQCGMTHQRERRRQRMSCCGEEPPLSSGLVRHFPGSMQSSGRMLNWQFRRRSC